MDRKRNQVEAACLSWLNLLVADMQTGFGPFVSVQLTAAGWNQEMIGEVLSAGTIAAMVAQVPAGALVDAVAAKRGVAAAAILLTMAAALVIAFRPSFVPVLVAEAMHGVAGVALALAIAAITLGLTQQSTLGERFGSNARFAAIGTAVGAAVLGLIGGRISHAAVFVGVAILGLPALLVLRGIHPHELEKAPLRTGHRGAVPPRRQREPVRPGHHVAIDRRLLLLMGCVALFHLANAAMLPLAAGAATTRNGMTADLLVSGAIVIPQVLTATLSPWIGRLAQRRGRRPLLLVGFAMLPLRGLLFAVDGAPEFGLVAQILDGITGASFGVLVPLVVADITHEGGRFNLALGMVGLATGIGATISTFAAGDVAVHLGIRTAFLCLAAIGAAATLLLWTALPETMHMPVTPPVASPDLLHRPPKRTP
jgi:MFS family permease